MRVFLSFVLVFSVLSIRAQEITQTIKGYVSDLVSATPVADVRIQISNGQLSFDAYTNESGTFSLRVPVGRYKVRTFHTSYENVDMELLVISGKESVLKLVLNPGVKTLEAVEVTGVASAKDVAGLRSLTIEKALRVPANFFDPVRVATAYPGVVATSDQNNSIIIRGNSPNGLLWRLNGLDIVNPNHLANAGTLSDIPYANGGGVNILSAQMLDRTDFYTGGFPATFGNSLSGIIDMRLRDGNDEKNEYTAQASLIGLDVAAEGPIEKSKSSFLANYRYSTVGLLSRLGVNFGDEEIGFKDLSFNMRFKKKNGGSFLLFGFWGESTNQFDSKDSSEWAEDKDKYDIFYNSTTYALGINYEVPLSKGKLFAGLSYSYAGQGRDAVVSDQILPGDRMLLTSLYNGNNRIVSAALRYEWKPGKNTTVDVGMMTNAQSNEVDFESTVGCQLCGSVEFKRYNASITGLLFQPYASVSAVLSQSVDLNVGIRYLQFTFNEKSRSVEPRIQLTKYISAGKLDLSYSLVSQLQPPHVMTFDNEELGFTRSHHGDISYSRVFARDLTIRTTLFYQHLFGVPIETGNTSTFSAINLLEEFAPSNLVNEGTGDNYGVDVTLEKFFYFKHYFLLGGSYYESTYTGADGIVRESRFNGNYTLSGIYGKEWINERKLRTVGLNVRTLYLGGLRRSAVDVTNSEFAAETVYDNTDPYSEKIGDYFRIDFRLSFRRNKPRYTRTFAIDIQNLTNQKNEAYRYYDFTQQKIVTKFQLGIIPVLVYRIDF